MKSNTFYKLFMYDEWNMKSNTFYKLFMYEETNIYTEDWYDVVISEADIHCTNKILITFYLTTSDRK